MKKLILSAVFALACFTAQANNEIIKNDDDKNPKAKAKVTKVLAPIDVCVVGVIAEVQCANGGWVSATGSAAAGNCRAAGKAAKLRMLADAEIQCSN